jgi:hypothetical protein
VVPGHAAEAKTAIKAVCSIVAAVGERYRQQKDLLSLVLLYESTQAGQHSMAQHAWLLVQCFHP